MPRSVAAAAVLSVCARGGGAAVLRDLPDAPCPAAYSGTMDCSPADPTLRAYMQGAAEDYCAAKGESASSLDFFYGYLPQVAFQQLPHCSAADKGYPDPLGALWLSGYWGGLWLAGVERNGSAGAQRAPPLFALPIPKNLTADVVVAEVAKLVATANTSDDTAVVRSCMPLLPVFMEVDAYNYGYLVAVSEFRNISTSDPSWLRCIDTPSYMCRWDDFPFDEQYFAAVEAQFNGSSTGGLRWGEVKLALQNTMVNSSITQGYNVWQSMGKQFHGEALVQLDLLGRKFLVISEGATNGCAVGYAEKDAPAARCGHDSMAGMIAWAGAYMLGLAAKVPGTVPQPTLDCTQ